ncbi:unnamed protein product [Ceratitis capitata]|uniref:(Mediterranean fruit fly) hypothetical protein n=1 Tax=Ceratitis capitata TaxID=7213 RepID=A0A811ULS5_CERCA|nr:unnamed protein product [Ceratitis capitata]
MTKTLASLMCPTHLPQRRLENQAIYSTGIGSIVKTSTALGAYRSFPNAEEVESQLRLDFPFKRDPKTNFRNSDWTILSLDQHNAQEWRFREPYTFLL